MDGQNPQQEPTDSAAQDDAYKDLRASSSWDCLIKEYERAFDTWHARQDNIDKMYANVSMLSRGDNAQREMKIFWANLQVLNPAVYSRPPTPVVAAKFKDRKQIVNMAAEVLERCLLSAFEREDIHQTIKLVRDDMTRNARGVLWIRYEERDGEQSVRFEHIDRRDFAHDPARKWKEVGWTARCAYLTRDEMKDRFEPVSGNLYLKAEYKTRKGDGKDEDDKETEKKAKVWEIWHKSRGVVAWWSPGIDEVLDIMDPPVVLEGFFPCPRPAFDTLQPGTLKPIPDVVYYSDQLEEINALTARIASLQEALRLKGFYSAGSEEVGDAIESAIRATDDNAILIPVSNVGHMGNGMKDAVVWMPLGEVVNAIQAAVLLRKQLIDDVYQITGLSDIMRGATDPNETLGAQQLKSQYGSIRVREKQEEMVRMSRDAARIAGEIIAENFSPETIMAMSQYENAPMRAQVEQQVMQIRAKVAQLASDPATVQAAQANPQQAQQIMQQAQQAVAELQQQITMDQIIELLRSERMRAFMLEIETDSTINVDEDAAKQRTTEFLGALATALSQLAPMVANQPQSAEFAGEVLKFAIQPFRAGRALDQAVDSFIEKIKAEAAQPKPNPEQQKLEAEMKTKEAEAQAKAADRQAESERKGEELRMKQAEHEMKMQEMQADRDYKIQDRQLQREILTEKRGFDQENHQRNMETRKGEVSMKRAEAGLPTEEVEQMQAEATIAMLQQTVEAVAQMADAVSQGQQALADSLQQLADSQEQLAATQAAPKVIQFDRNGNPVGIQTVVN
jgi:hypothetical protein